jgi:hypothetical protein
MQHRYRRSGHVVGIRRGLLVGLLALALLLPGVAAAVGYAYAENWYWMYPGKSAGSSFNSAWRHNWFIKKYPGYDTTVTFIDNTTYSWHATVRNDWQTTPTTWSSGAVKKAHCRSNTAVNFSGTCAVASD